MSRVAASTDPGEIRKILTFFAHEFMRRHFESRRGARKADADLINLAIDGKTSVGATLRGMNKSVTHIANAVCCPITVGMEPVREKSNEITAIPILLDRLNDHGLVKGKVVTADAMGRQRLMAEKILA